MLKLIYFCNWSQWQLHGSRGQDRHGKSDKSILG